MEEVFRGASEERDRGRTVLLSALLAEVEASVTASSRARRADGRTGTSPSCGICVARH
jgi:hypothetical protein